MDQESKRHALKEQDYYVEGFCVCFICQLSGKSLQSVEELARSGGSGVNALQT